MNYRNFGTTGWKASALGFGAMRLPVTGQDHHIDEPLAIAMIRRAIDAGVNYLDTAYGYHDKQSEVLVGKALRDGYRERVKLATKMPMWLVKETADFDRLFDEQLGKLQTDHVDLYLLHAINKAGWDKAAGLGAREWLLRQHERGRIGWIGFSFHGEAQDFPQIVDAWDRWDFCQIQYNYMDEEIQAGTKGLRHAAARKIAVVVMEPLQGGNLVSPPPAVSAVWDSMPLRRSPADWGLQWVWDQPEVSVVLSGMSTMEQVEQNVRSAERSGVGSLSPLERTHIHEAAETYRGLRPIPCTQCNYCMPCPHGVEIPHNLGIWNRRVMYNNLEGAKIGYHQWTKPEQRASECTACLECEEKCPQKIVIHEWMECIAKELA